VKGLARFVLGERSRLISGAAISCYDMGMNSIRYRGDCLNKMWAFLLRAFSANDALQSSLAVILEGNNMMAFLQLAGTASTSNSVTGLLTDKMYSYVNSAVQG